MTLDVHGRRAQQNGAAYSHLSRSRAPDLIERLLMLIVAGGALASLLLTVAATLGAIWLIAVIVADLTRRLGL
jgi:hypothetical protein